MIKERDKIGVNPAKLPSPVRYFADNMPFFFACKRILRLPVQSLFLFLSIVSCGGLSASKVLILYYGSYAGSTLRTVQYSLVVLSKAGLVECRLGRWYVSAKGLEAIRRVESEFEGADKPEKIKKQASRVAAGSRAKKK